MPLAATLLGLAIVLATLRDVVHELFDPEDSGSMSRVVMHGAWRAIRAVARRYPSFVYHAGHMVLVSVAVLWTTLLTVGWALVYWPQLPQGFHVDGSLPSAAGHGFGTALYVSLTSLTTLGSSDVVPVGTALRMASAAESLVGVGMITAWISWVLSVYPVLSARRVFEKKVFLLQEESPDADHVIDAAPPEALAETLRSLTEQVLRVGIELSQSRVTYYFQNRSPEISLSRQLPYVLALSRAAEERGTPAVCHHGRLLRRGVESLLDDVGSLFLRLEHAPPEEVVRALEEDHLLSGGSARR